MSLRAAFVLCVVCSLYSIISVDAAEPCRLIEGDENGHVLDYQMCEDRCVNTTGVLVCTPQICTKNMTLFTPNGTAAYTIGFCNGSTDFDCGEHLLTEGFRSCDTEEPSCAGVNETCRRGYYFIDPFGTRQGNHAICGDVVTELPLLPETYVLCGHEAFLTPEQRAILAAEAAAEAAEGGGATDGPETR